MSSRSRAWLVAASIGAVEALKDQGFCRWNYAFRVVQQHAKTNLIRPYTSQANKLSSAAAVSAAGKKTVTSQEERVRRSEESLRNVMYLSCWGPN